MQYIALGANLEIDGRDLGATLTLAVQAMVDSGLSIRAVSRFFRSPCFPAGAGPDYVNAVVGIEAALAPQDLLATLHQIETSFGRVRQERWGQRTLDLDLLSYEDLVHPDPKTYEHWRDLPVDLQKLRAPDDLILPHPRLHERAFVLVPLSDIAPSWRHPVLDCTTTELLSKLDLPEVSAVVPL